LRGEANLRAPARETGFIPATGRSDLLPQSSLPRRRFHDQERAFLLVSGKELELLSAGTRDKPGTGLRCIRQFTTLEPLPKLLHRSEHVLSGTLPCRAMHLRGITIDRNA